MGSNLIEDPTIVFLASRNGSLCLIMRGKGTSSAASFCFMTNLFISTMHIYQYNTPFDDLTQGHATSENNLSFQPRSDAFLAKNPHFSNQDT